MTEENQLLINRIESLQKEIKQVEQESSAKEQAHRQEIKKREDQYEMDKFILQ